MRNRVSVLFIGMLCGVALVLPHAQGQALVDHVPADALAYVGWKGSDALAPQYEKSKLKTFIDHSAVPSLLNESLPRLLEKLSKDDPASADDFQLASHFAKLIAKHPTAIYLAGLDLNPDDNEPSPKFGLICQAGEDKDTLLALFNKLAAGAEDPKFHARVLTEGDLIAYVVGYADTDKPLAGWGVASDGSRPPEALSGSPSFVAAKAHFTTDSAVVVYVNFEQALAKIDADIKAAADEPSYAMWTRGRDAAGIAGLKLYTYSAGFVGEEWASQTYIGAPAPRTGLLKLLEPSPIDAGLLAKIPNDATTASIAQFDFAALIATAKDITTAVNPQAGSMFQKGLGFISLSLGRRLDSEILAPLGSQWAIYSAPSLGGNEPTSIVIANKLDDPKLAKDAWGDLAFAISNMLPNILRQHQGIVITPGSDDKAVPGSTMYTWKIGNTLWTPSFVVSGDYLYLGSDPAVVAKTATSAVAGDIQSTAAFKTLKEQVNAPAVNSFSLSDLANSVDTKTQAVEAEWAALRQVAQQQNVELPDTVLPTAEQVKPLLSRAGSIGWADETGLYSKERSPFPFAAALYSYGQGDQMTTAVGVSALGVSVLLPSLNKARETANRVKSAADLKQIGNGCILYANENKGAAPPDLGTLLLQEELTVDVFTSPSSNTHVPDDVRSGTPAQQAAWVNAHSDFVYIKPAGALDAVGSDIPLAYEKIGIHDNDGINILYGDGHVEFQRMKAALGELQKANIAEPVKYDGFQKKPTTRPGK